MAFGTWLITPYGYGVCWPPTQWAKTVISRTFGHKLGKKSDTDVVEGLLEAYYELKHKKMTKYENWHPGSKIFLSLFFL